uniref:OO_Ba0013J05-OO_Ba0033A15.22 protein n=1 Tax=Oryza officinalis TaxID=4535 RepID=D0ABG5_9ORYZ|nr:OO_Ba0013J05-OO_Ba0033A15.22 [Oryza officinalis]
MVEEREISFDQWAASDVKETTLKEMVKEGVLPAKEIIGWRPTFGKCSSHLKTSCGHTLISSHASYQQQPTEWWANNKPQLKNKRTTTDEKNTRASKQRKLIIDSSDEESKEIQTPSGNTAPSRPTPVRLIPKIKNQTGNLIIFNYIS